MTKHDTYTLGDYLGACRQLRGWTMAQAAPPVGIAASNISKIERNISLPRAETMAGLARGLGCPWWGKEENETWLTQVAWALTGDPAFAAGRAKDVGPMLTQAQTWAKDIRPDRWAVIRPWANANDALIGLARADDGLILVPLLAWILAEEPVLREREIGPILERVGSILNTRKANREAAGSDLIDLPSGDATEAFKKAVRAVRERLATLDGSAEDLSAVQTIAAYLGLREDDRAVVDPLIQRLRKGR